MAFFSTVSIWRSNALLYLEYIISAILSSTCLWLTKIRPNFLILEFACF